MRQRKKLLCIIIGSTLLACTLIVLFIVPWSTSVSVDSFENGCLSFFHDDAVYRKAYDGSDETAVRWILPTDDDIIWKGFFTDSFSLSLQSLYCHRYDQTEKYPIFLYIKETDTILTDQEEMFSTSWSILYDPYSDCTCRANWLYNVVYFPDDLNDPVEMEYTLSELEAKGGLSGDVNLQQSGYPIMVIRIVYYEGSYYFYLPGGKTENVFYRIPNDRGEKIWKFYKFPNVSETTAATDIAD